MPEDHRHLLHLDERQIVCVCEPCSPCARATRELRPTGTRTLWLDDFVLSDELWAAFQIPIGLAFFLVSEVAGGVVALYPSPAGATESELDLEAWDELVAANPVLDELEPEVEALIVNRLVDPHAFAIVPIDRCYELVGLIKATWEGISGGDAVEAAVEAFFARLRSARPESRSSAALRRASPRRSPRAGSRRSSGCSTSPGCPTPRRRRCASASASTETSGREVYTIALTAQINIEPARRRYDAETRAALVELFGAPERWGATTKSFLWTQVSTLVPSFTGDDHVHDAGPVHLRPRAGRRQVPLRVPDGEVPLAFHFTGIGALRRRRPAAADRRSCRGRCSADWRMPVATWREMMQHYYPDGGWVRLHDDTIAALSRRRAARGLPSFDACVAELLEDA